MDLTLILLVLAAAAPLRAKRTAPVDVAEKLEEADLGCPFGWTLVEEELKRGQAQPAGLSRFVEARDEDGCFRHCELAPDCLSATFDEGSGECVERWVIGATLGTLCREFRAARDGVPWERLATLRCSSGCVRLSKVCSSCDSQTLKGVISAAFCMAGLFRESPKAVCAGSPSEAVEGPSSGQDQHRYCCFWAARGECESNPFFMKVKCSSACGTAGCSVKRARSCPVKVRAECRTPSAELASSKAAEVEPAPEDAHCPDRHPLCSFWAFQGECKANPVYMRRNCKRSCRLC